MSALLKIFVFLLAALLSFQAQTIVLTQTVPLHFGSVPGFAGFNCVMTESGDVTGDCDAVDANIMLGQITVTDLVRGSQVEIIVNGSTNPSLSYTPTTQINGGKGGRVISNDGQPVIIDIKGNGADLVIDVYGVINLQSYLGSGATYTADYTVQVNQL